MQRRKIVKYTYNTLVVLLLISGAVYVCSRFFHPGRVEFTDDAEVRQHITPLNTRVQGFIKEIRFDDYQQVHKGDTLVIIEDAEYRLRLAQAEADLSNATTGKSAAGAGIRTTQSNMVANEAGAAEVKAQLDNARRDFERYAKLLKEDAVTQQQYDGVRTAYEAAQARYRQMTQHTETTALARNEQTVRLGQNSAGIRLAKAAVDLARLNLSYTVIVAPCDGVVGRKDIHVGQLVQPGQSLADLVDGTAIWIVANYRETQLPNIREGATVDITVDAVPSVKYQGKVERLSGSTGAAVSVIPQDNAAGNFVKVERRVPVRINISGNKPADLRRLRAGLNVECEVKY